MSSAGPASKYNTESVNVHGQLEINAVALSGFDHTSQMSEEIASGVPQPQLYDQHYINKYAYPKGLKCTGRRIDREVLQKKSLYDM